MFEQSLLLEQGNKKPWNFLASFGVQLALISLALLIPLIFRDRLPVVHFKDVMMGPPPSQPPEVAETAHSQTVSTAPALAPRRVFHLDPRAPLQPAVASSNFVTETPPMLGVQGIGDGLGGRANNSFLPNVVALPPPPNTSVEKTQPSAPVRVTSDLQMAMLLRKVIPAYPPIAKANRISGVVRLIGTIGKDGTIKNLQLVSGHPLLAHAALEAVRQWVYRPTILNGMPVEVIAPIEVNFTLAQ